MRVALIKLGALGDVVRTTSLVAGLRRAHPALALTWITSEAAYALVRHHPDVREVHGPDDQGAWRTATYDWVISLDDDRAACRVASRLTAQRLSGAYEGPEGGLQYTPDVEEWFGMGLLRPARLGGLDQANALKRANVRTFGDILFDGLGLPGPVPRPEVHVPAPMAEAAHTLLRKLAPDWHRPVVALNTGAGPRWKYKSWGEEQTAQLARRLADEVGATVLVCGGREEAERNSRIVSAAGRGEVVRAPGDLGLLTFTALLGACQVVVSSDSLALHLAVTQRVPVVTVFGPTSDAEIDLFGAGEKVVTGLPCRRCYLKDCEVRPHCMQSIGVDQLFAAACRWLPRSSATR